MGYDTFDIIADLTYSNEDIKELIENKSNNYASIGIYTSAILLGTCNATAASDLVENHREQNKPEIEVMAGHSEFLLEDYRNVFLADDYNLWSNEILVNKKKECIESILSFRSLQESWDGYGAYPLEVKSATNSIEFLETLGLNHKFITPTDIFPNPTGTVSLIWENNEDERLSLEIGNNAYSYYTKFNVIGTEFFNDIEINESNIGNITRKIKALF